MKIIDESIHFVTLKLKSSIKDLKYVYSRSEGGDESVVQEMSRGKKYAELLSFYDFVETGLVNTKKKFLEYLLTFLIKNAMRIKSEHYCQPIAIKQLMDF